MDSRIVELHQRMDLCKGQIMEALGDLGTISNIPEVYRAERALRYAIAELNGTVREVVSPRPVLSGSTALVATGG